LFCSKRITFPFKRFKIQQFGALIVHKEGDQRILHAMPIVVGSDALFMKGLIQIF